MTKIFIIHGWTYTTEKWNDLIRKLGTAGFEIHMLSVPGLTEPSDKIWNLDQYIEWLKAKLDREDKPVLIGHSNGGRIGLAFAAKYPEKLGHLILIDSAGIYHNELKLRLKRAVFGTVAKLGKKFTSSEKLRNMLYTLTRENDYKNASPQMRLTMANLIQTDLTPLLNKISTPTLIIWGAKDKLTPLADGEKMNQQIQMSKLFVIPEAGHSPHFTHAEETSAKILEELGQ